MEREEEPIVGYRCRLFERQRRGASTAWRLYGFATSIHHVTELERFPPLGSSPVWNPISNQKDMESETLLISVLCRKPGQAESTADAPMPHGMLLPLGAFYPNKQIITGEGGMVVTDDPEIARLCRSMANQGRGEAGVWLSHERLGFNYRMDEMSAALGWAQMQRIEEIIEKRQHVADMYNERLSKIPGIWLPRIAPEVTRMSWFVYVIRVGTEEPNPERQSEIRNHVMEVLQKNEVGCRPYFTPIHLQPFYKDMFGFKEGDFPVTEKAGRTSIAIPFHNNLTREEVEYVAQVLEEAIKTA